MMGDRSILTLLETVVDIAALRYHQEYQEYFSKSRNQCQFDMCGSRVRGPKYGKYPLWRWISLYSETVSLTPF
jgi:hypothetical protein